MPAVGIDSINLSSKDIEVVADFFTAGFFRGFLIVGFLLLFVVGDFDAVALGEGFRVTFGLGTELLDGAGMTVVDFSPLPRRPSMTIWPSWV